MTDKELLELAAKACGWKQAEYQDMTGWGEVRYGFSHAMYVQEIEEYWNPLVNHAQTFELQSRMGFSIEQWNSSVHVRIGSELIHREVCLRADKRDAFLARAIVSAAAQIGKDMKCQP